MFLCFKGKLCLKVESFTPQTLAKLHIFFWLSKYFKKKLHFFIFNAQISSCRMLIETYVCLKKYINLNAWLIYSASSLSAVDDAMRRKDMNLLLATLTN